MSKPILDQKIWLLPLALLAACATPPAPPPSNETQPQADPARTMTAPPAASLAVEALRNLVSMQDRLDRIAAPLLLKNAALCKNQARNLLGFSAKNRYSYSSEFVDAAQQLLGLQEKLQIIAVLPGSGAAQAGIRRGDTLVKVEDKDLPQGQNAERLAATILAPLVAGKASVRITISRDGAQQQLNVPLTRACGFRVELGNADNVASYADGQRIMITRGLLAFAKSDEEVAYLIAKEMAHNALSHPARHRSYHAMGQMIDNLIQVKPDLSLLLTGGGIKPYPAEMDVAADNLSLYLAARGGYSIDQALPFWRRLAEQYPATVLSSHTAIHPKVALRMGTLEITTAEVKARLAEGRPLMPPPPPATKAPSADTLSKPLPAKAAPPKKK